MFHLFAGKGFKAIGETRCIRCRRNSHKAIRLGGTYEMLSPDCSSNSGSRFSNTNTEGGPHMPKLLFPAILLILIAACGQQTEPYVDPETGEVTYGD